MKYSIGIDIGGTKVALAIVEETGKIIEQSKIATDLSISPRAMIDRINKEVVQMLQQSAIDRNDVIGMGVGSPGPIDRTNGMVTCPPNLPSWVDIPIVSWLKETWDMPIIFENDANAAALAEQWLGAAQENENFIYITVSTGVGSGIVMDGKLLHGRKGNAGDIGHIVVDPSFGKCSCGQYGCLESIASGTAIAKHGSEIVGKELSTKEIFALYEEGHQEIVPLIDNILRVLGAACVSLINTFDPEKIVIGGGVTKVGDLLFDSIRNYVRTFALNPTGRQTEIVPAKLDQEVGVIGAAALCFLKDE